MPKAAIERRHINNIVSLEEMGDFLVEFFVGKEKVYGTGN